MPSEGWPPGEGGALPSAATIDHLIKMVADTDVETVDLRWGKVRMKFVQWPGTPLRPERVNLAADQPETEAIAAPLTGVYYARPAPDQEDFVSVGAEIVPGQVVGLIETMKLFNEVVSEIGGRVTEILVADGDLVEKQQPLMRVKAAERNE